MEQVTATTNVTVTLSLKVARFITRLAELLDDKRSTEGLVNAFLEKQITTLAKSEARLVRSEMGKRTAELKKHGLSREQIDSIQDAILKQADELDSLASKLIAGAASPIETPTVTVVTPAPEPEPAA